MLCRRVTTCRPNWSSLPFHARSPSSDVLADPCASDSAPIPVRRQRLEKNALHRRRQLALSVLAWARRRLRVFVRGHFETPDALGMVCFRMLMRLFAGTHGLD